MENIARVFMFLAVKETTPVLATKLSTDASMEREH